MAGVQAGSAFRVDIDFVAKMVELQNDLAKVKKAVRDAGVDIARSTKAANDNLAGMGRGITGAGNASRVANHHLANLSFQLQDIVVGLKSGQAPMTVFLQQGGQVAQIMGQAGIGVGGLAKAVGGMVARFVAAHPVMTALGVAAGVATFGFKLLAEQTNARHRSELDAYAKSLDLTAKEIEKAGGAAVTAGDMIGGLWDVIREALGLESIFTDLKRWFVDTFTVAAVNAKKNISEIYAAIAAAVDAIKAVWGNVGPIMGDAVISGANIAIAAVEALINRSIVAVGKLVENINPILSPLGRGIDQLAGTITLGRIANPYAAAGANAADSFASAYQRRLGEAEAGFDRFMEDWGEAGVNRRNQRLLAQVEEAAEKAGKKAGKKAAQGFGLSFAEAFKDIAEDLKRREALLGDNMRLEQELAGLEREAKAVGLVGWERQRLLLILEREAEIAPFREQLAEAERNGLDTEATRLRLKIDLLDKIRRQQIENGNAEEDWRKAKDAARDYNDSLRDIISSLQSIGGFGGVIGGLLGLLSGNFREIDGPLGALLNINVAPLGKEIKRLGDVFTDAIGGLGKTLFGALQSAGIGVMAGTAILGKQGTAGMIGGAAGGILGGIGGGALAGTIGAAATSAFGTAIGAAIGSAVPILGTILGGLAGTLIGGLFKKAQQTYADFGDIGAGKFEVQGGSAYTSQANELGRSVLDGLGQIADQLGATLGNFNLKIGVRDGQIRVDPTGSASFKNSVGFGEDAQAAVAFALQDAIKDGALMGMRAGTQALLSKEGDFETQLAKALAFEQVFKDIEQEANPFVAQLKAMETQFGQLKAIFAEAGASAEEYASLQGYLIRQQQALIDQAMASYRSTFYSDAENAAFAKQQIASVLGPLGFGSTDTVAEYRALVEATDALAKPELFGALMGLVDAFGTLKEAEEAAAAATEALAIQQAAAAEAAYQEWQRRIETAQSVLRSAYDRQAGELRETIDSSLALAKGLRDLRLELLAGEGTADTYAMRLAALRRVGGLAQAGDIGSQQQLESVIRDFLPAAKAQARTAIEYQRAVALAARYAGSAANAADIRAVEAQKQLDALTQLVGLHIDLNAGVVSVEQAIRDLIALQSGAVIAPVVAAAALPIADPAVRRAEREAEIAARKAVRDEERRLRIEEALSLSGGGSTGTANDNQTAAAVDNLEQRMTDLHSVMVSNVVHTSKVVDALEDLDAIWRRLSPDGLALRIATDGRPIEVA